MQLIECYKNSSNFCINIIHICKEDKKNYLFQSSINQFLNLWTYEAISGAKDESHDIILSHKRRVIQFVQEWQSISGEEFLEDNTISAFLKVSFHIEFLVFVLKKDFSGKFLMIQIFCLLNIIKTFGIFISFSWFHLL